MSEKTIAGLETNILTLIHRVNHLERRVEALEKVAFKSDWRQGARDRLKASTIITG